MDGINFNIINFLKNKFILKDIKLIIVIIIYVCLILIYQSTK